jgi:acyl carrier protein
MTSGTTGNAKLCAYNAENIYYQIRDSVKEITTCKPIQAHYNGELKLLMLLPLYHIFGFIANFMWFTLMSRTFVFLKDLKPQTLLSTVKRHKVTHVFAVPLVWNAIYKEAIKKIKARGEKTYQKALKGLSLSINFGKLGKMLTKSAFSEVRSNIFGDSIQFCITGGGAIKKEVLEFFNGIGYHLTNGFGMTEVGVTGVELSTLAKERVLGSIGKPFASVQYKINEKGELTVKSKGMAYKILVGDKTLITDYNEFFNTKDLAKIENDRYYLCGRVDDLIVAETGENINPELVESKLLSPLASGVCLFADKLNTPTLIVSVENRLSPASFKKLQEETAALLEENNLQTQIKKVVFVSDALMEKGDFKVSRKKIATKYNNGFFTVINPLKMEEENSEILSATEEKVISIFASVLNINKEQISKEHNFFTDLSGSSLEYFTLVDEIGLAFNKTITQKEGEPLLTPNDFCKYLNEN